MRQGVSSRFRSKLNRYPSPVIPFAEILTTEAQDLIDTNTRWATANSTAGLSISGGAVTLTGTSNTFVSHATGSATTLASLVNPVGAPALSVAAIQWDGDVATRELHSFTARLDPAAGGTQNVTTWVGQLFSLYSVEANWVGSAAKRWTIRPISAPVAVTAGSIAADVEFTFASPAVVGMAPVLIPDEEGDFPLPGDAPTVPTTVVVVWALQPDGTPATNVAWVTDDSTDSKTISGHTVGRYVLDIPTDGAYGGLSFRNVGTSNGVPRFALIGRTYSPVTVTFSTNPLDLGASPGGSTIIEMVAEARARGGAVAFEIWSGSAWVAFSDGDRIGVGALAGISRTQTYDVRVTLTPSSVGSSPIVQRMGVRELGTSEYVAEGITFSSPSWAVDPLTGRSEIPELVATLIVDGRRDYRSLVEDLLATYHINDIQVRVWMGDLNDARADWLHIDDFLLDDYTAKAGAVELVCVSPLSLARREVPESTGATIEPLVYLADTPADVADDLIVNQMGVPARYVGQGITAATPALSREIRDRTQARDLLDEVAFIAGGAYVSSQGRLKAVDMFGADSPADPDLTLVIPEEADLAGFSPGYRARVTSSVVKWGWDNARRSFQGAERVEAAPALIAALGRSTIDFEEQLPDSLCQWLGSEAVATPIAERMVEYFAPGMKLVRLKSAVRRPWLEPGDPINVRTDLFIGRDPETGRSIRGPMVALARVQRVDDIEGTDITAWIRTWEDVVTTDTAVAIQGFAPEPVYDLTNLREVSRDQFAVTFRATMGSALADVFVYHRLITQPVTADPWPGPETVDLIPLIVQRDEADEMVVTLDLPAEQQLRYVQIEPKAADGTTRGPVYRMILFPVGDVDKTVYWTITVRETSGVGTVRIGVMDPDELLDPVTPISFDVTVDTEVSEGLAPTRTIAPNVWEMDAALHPKHNTIIEPVLHLLDGGEIRPGAETFDVDRVAHILSARVSNDDDIATVLVDGDSDCVALYYQEEVPDEDGEALLPEELMDQRESNPRLGVIVVTRDITRRRTFYVYGRNAADEDGPRVEVEVDKLEMAAGAGPGAASSLDFTITDDGDCGTEDPAMATVTWEWFVTASGFTATLERQMDADPWDMRVAGLLITSGEQFEVDQFEGYENDPLGSSSVRVRYRLLTVRTSDSQVVATTTTPPVFLDLQACP
jgi:hypothetical protein